MRFATLALVLQLFFLREFTTAETPDVIQELVSLGGTVTLTIRNGFSDVVTGCLLESPQGVLYQFRPESNSTNEDLSLQPTSMLSSCSVAVRNVKEEYLGEWTLYSNIRDGNHDEFELVQVFQIIDRDAPANDSTEASLETESAETPALTTEEPTELPAKESTEASLETESAETPELTTEEPTELPELTPEVPELTTEEPTELPELSPEVPELTTEVPETITELQIRTLDKILYETPLRRTFETRIPRTFVNTVESCHLKTPAGVELVLSPDLEYPGLLVTEGNLMSSCIITMTVTEEMNGEWELYSRETNSEEQHEIRQPFTVSIEEPIGTFPKDLLTVEVLRDLYIRLDRSIEGVKSCALVPPAGASDRLYFHDERYASSCGFVVPRVLADDAGEWAIVADGRIRYKGHVDVSVEGADHPTTLHPVTAKHGEPVEMDIGPENALFCQLRSPEGSVAFSGFRACRLELDVAGWQHAGEWTLRVGLPGRLQPLYQRFRVKVEEPEITLNSITHEVKYSADAATLTCSMLTDVADPVGSFCKFVRPDSAVFIANEGVGEGRYSYFGNGVSTTDSGHTLVECGLHISTIIDSDLGTWRCLLESAEGVASSFLRVSNVATASEDLTSEEEMAAEAVMEVRENSIVALAGEEITISCSVNAQLDYCWFRSQNGTVISVAPGVSGADYEYAGGGFGAGECGLRVRAASTADSGAWTCSVGMRGVRDRSVGVDVVVHASPLVMSQNLYYRDRYTVVLVVEGRMYNNSAVRYCRFVNPLGEGFNTLSSGVSGRYDFRQTDLAAGLCRLSVVNPLNSEIGSWTVAAGLNATGREVSTRTHMHLAWGGGTSTATYLMVVVIVVCLNVCFISILVNKRSRRWTSERASSVGNTLRNSFRRSRTQGPALKDAPPSYDTAMSSREVAIDADQGTADVSASSTSSNQSRTDQNSTLIDLTGASSNNETPASNDSSKL